MRILLVSMLLFSISTSTSLSAEEKAAENEGSGDQAQETERVAYLDPEYKEQQALAATLKQHEIVWLDVNYPDYPEAQKVLAISHPSLIPEKQGAILFLHDKEQHADWPEVISPLRKKLPKAGWFTLSVNLPDDTRIKLPERSLEAKTFDQVVLSANLRQNLESGVRKTVEPTGESEETVVEPTSVEENEEPESEAANAQTESVDIDLALEKQNPELNKIPYELRALAHIEKGMEYLQSQNYQNIVLIAHRHSAELALHYIKAHQNELVSPGFALVLIEPIIPETFLLDIQEWFGEGFQAPILEIIDRSSVSATEFAEETRLALVRAGIEKHRQLLLTMNNSKVFEDALTRRIRQWLDSQAPGMKIER